MTYRLSTVLSVVVALFATVAWAGAGKECGPLKQLASANMGTLPSGLVYLPANVAGHIENFVLATNDLASYIAASTANSLGLPRSKIRDAILRFGTTQLEDYAVAQPAGVGQITGTIRFAVIPDGNTPPDVVGTIGMDFLQNFDTEIDFLKGKINLYSPDHCGQGVVFWTGCRRAHAFPHRAAGIDAHRRCAGRPTGRRRIVDRLHEIGGDRKLQ